MALYKHGFELQLKASEARFRSLFENSQDVIYISDKSGNLLEINPAGLKLFGYSHAEILHTNMESLYQNPVDHSALLTALRESRNITDFEVELKKKDGTPMACLQSTQVRIDEKSSIMDMQGIIRDITELKRAETERKSLESQLFQAQKMEALGQLAGGVAHDFNNLLTGISGFAKFALEQVPQGSSAREDLSEVLKLAKRAETLTRQLLTFSRRQTLQPKVLNINRTVEEMMKMLGRLIGENIKLVFLLAPDLGDMNIDPGQLEQVLMNLAVNARDAMPAGGNLTVETANIFLDQDYARANIGVTPGEYIMLAVSDTGCGMDDNTRQHIFEPFFTTKPQGKGTGLGLSTVYGIVNQLKGSILVDSNPGQGSTFKVYLPMVVPDAVEKPPAAAGKEPSRKGTILIIEDDAAVLQITQRVLEVNDYRVLTAASSLEADKVLAIHGESVDLILLDVVLPGLDGYQLFESWVKSYPHLLVLYMSGYMDNAIVNKKILAHGIPFIQKPFTAETLVLKVLEALGEKHHD
jgi:two-component system cell cycle sensor histidine kinase/response regulator CckA